MNGFLDTEGELHECEAWGHPNLAAELVKNMGVSVVDAVEAEGYLQKLGWLVIRTFDIWGLVGYYNENNHSIYHLTEKQKEWLNRVYPDMTLWCRKSVDYIFERDKQL